MCRVIPSKYLTHNSIEFLGRVDDLTELYYNCNFILAPILGGAGMKIKVIEAIAHSKTVVGTPKAFDGINVSNRLSALVADNAITFSKCVCELYCCDSLNSIISKNASYLYDKDHSFLATTRALKNVFPQ